MPKSATTPDLDETEEILSQPRDPFFNPFRVPKSANVRAIIADVLNQLDGFEEHSPVRKRARRKADQVRYERIVSSIICDLTHRSLIAPGEGQALAITLSKTILGRSGRYSSPVLSKTLPDVLDRLAAPEMTFVESVKGQKGNPFLRGRRTTITAGDRLLKRVDDHNVELADLRQSLDQELVILKKTRDDFWKTGDRIDYRENTASRRYRAEMLDINRWLDDAPITWDERVWTEWPDGTDRVIDLGDRLLRRYFNNGSFEEGGRLFGGFWQGLKKVQRREGIRIKDEPVITLDYAQMAPRILYSMAGLTPPEGDAYAIPRYPLWRSGIKKVFSALQFVKGDLLRKPKGTKKLLPHHRITDITAAIRTHHAPIAHLLDDLVGHQVFFRESQIMVDVLLRLKSLGIVALPIHDAVVIPQSREAATRTVMLDAFREHLGFEGRVEVE